MPKEDNLKTKIWQRLPSGKFSAFAGLTFACYLGLDVLTPCYFQNPYPAIILAILLVGQLTLICVWGTLVEGTFWIRLPWTILLLVISWAALCQGVYIDNGRSVPAEFMGMGLVWLYGFAISYVPLKIAAWAFGWRIQLISQDPSANQSRRYAIGDLMLGTAILAAALAIGRQSMPGDLPSWSNVLNASRLDSAEPLLIIFNFSVISLIAKLPCIWIALAAPQSSVLRQSLIWVACSGALGLIEMVILFSVLGDPGPQTVDFAFSLVVGHSLMAASMIAVLYGLRCFGYRMSRKTKDRNIAVT